VYWAICISCGPERIYKGLICEANIIATTYKKRGATQQPDIHDLAQRELGLGFTFFGKRARYGRKAKSKTHAHI